MSAKVTLISHTTKQISIKSIINSLFFKSCSNIEKNIESNQDVNQTSKEEAASTDGNDNILEITKKSTV